MVKRIADMQKTIDKLESDKKTLTTGSNDKDNQIRTLNRETDRLNGVIRDRENTIATRESTIAARESTIAERDNTLAARQRTITNRNDVITRIRNEVELDQDYDDIPPAQIKVRISRIQDALRALTP